MSNSATLKHLMIVKFSDKPQFKGHTIEETLSN